jgi:hypothetical protein
VPDNLNIVQVTKYYPTNIRPTQEKPMSEQQFIPDGYCGLFCGSCGIYLATKNGTEKKFAEENNMPLEMVSCYGCRTDKNPVWCTQCKLKSCARNRGFDFCYECADYPCENLEAFKNDPLYPYHLEVYDYMETKGKKRGCAK